MTALANLSARLDAVPGTVSVYCGSLGGPAGFVRNEHVPHYAASTMKVAVLAALHRSGLDLDAPVPVHNTFRSAAPGGGTFGCSPDEDGDAEVWRNIGGTAKLRWLARRMIVASGNLATNLCLASVGLPAVAQVWRLVGARHSVVGRGIEDYASREAGITNLVTAADLAALLGAVATGAAAKGAVTADADATGAVASRAACDEMLDLLLAQEHDEDLAAGLPPGTRIAHKNGWITGIRHGAAVIYPDDAPPYLLVVCTTTPLATGSDRTDPACALLADIAAASWQDRHTAGPQITNR